MSHELTVFLLGATPISELRGAIPLGIAFGLEPATTYVLAVLGNLMPIIPAFIFFRVATKVLRKESGLVNKFFAKLFEATRARHEHRFTYTEEKKHLRPWLEALTLFLFVAIPLPFTGIWSGTLAAFIFGVPLKRAFFAMAVGVLFSGLIVLGISLGVVNIF